MTEILLKELSTSDIDWIKSAGKQRRVGAGEILIHKEQTVNSLYILINGTLAVTVSTTENNSLHSAFKLLENNESLDKEIMRVSSGEIVGEIPLLNVWRQNNAVKAIEHSVVLSISGQTLQAKLEQDINFAARFYRAIAILYADKIQSTIDRLGRTKIAQGQPLKDIFFIFELLHDSDFDWLL